MSNTGLLRNKNELYQLPRNWDCKPLSDLAEDTERLNPSKTFPDRYFQYVDISSIDNKLGIITQCKTILGRQAPSRARKIIKADNIVVATTRPSLKNIAIIPSELDDALCSTGFCVLKAKPGIALPKYIYYACRSDFFINQLIPKQRGANYPAITDSNVFQAVIPIPDPNNPSRSLDIQGWIVERIEALLTEIKASHDLLAKMRQDTERVINVALEEVVQGFPSARKTLSDVLDLKPRNGWSPKCDNNPDGVPVLKLGAVLRFRYHPNEIKRTSLPVDPNAHYWLQAGDLLISRSNTPELVGHAAIYSGNPFPCIYPDLLMRMTVDELKADSQFVIYWLQTAEVREYVQTRTSGVSSTMKKITKTDVCNIPFPEISLREQNQFTLYLNSIQQETEAMLKTLEQDAQLLDQLERSILERAFRGEL